LSIGWVETSITSAGVNKARLVEAVAAHHATEGVGDETLHVLAAVGAVERNLLVGNFGEEFVL